MANNVAEEATGCLGAGDYRQYAEQLGYNFIEVVDWCSSAGDWTFIVSKNGREWHIMSQENNYPQRGFTRHISDEEFYGSNTEVLQQIADIYNS